ncbi:Hypothetical protein GLP15_5042 [Giardia lamblia P15]|uniref:Uncharacterized protein n=1 Tax=Giardia intestinalis (strain P15) TaxID=658858 RepID=E1EZK2_GIAIA|nr:Hypothetical protein GLP15_5042 [Giardia lamblia P15]
MFPRPAEIYYPNKKAISEKREQDIQECIRRYTPPSWEKLPELTKPMSFATYMQRIGTTQPSNQSTVRNNVGQYRDLQKLSNTTPIAQHSSELIGAVSLSKYQQAYSHALKANPSIFHRTIGPASSEVDRLLNAGYKKIY